MATFQHILVAIDGSPLSVRAVDVAVSLSKDLLAQLGFVYVVDPGLGAISEGGLPADVLLEDRRQEGRAALQAAVARAQAEPPAWSFLKEGKAAPEILAAAKEWGADLIALGTHGRSGLGRVVLGSVAQAVLHEAPCPVLMIRAGSVG
jgi:nucleotide-binding universal stress UspA family protein